MDDRELLELAAKAAGYLNWTPRAKGLYIETGSSRGSSGFYWNPLDDDGDALRLAVKLGIDLEWRNDGRVAAYRHANANGHCFTAFESSREERDAATRRAIVRAAAEIGKEQA